jgi:hypothetical protein
MKQKVKSARTLSENTERRGLSQVVFVMIGLGIILGGLWTLYMGDAPYHPEYQGPQNSAFLTSE